MVAFYLHKIRIILIKYNFINERKYRVFDKPRFVLQESGNYTLIFTAMCEHEPGVSDRYQIGQPSFRPFSGDRRPAMLGVTVTVTVFLSLSLSRVTLGNSPRLPACKSI